MANRNGDKEIGGKKGENSNTSNMLWFAVACSALQEQAAAGQPLVVNIELYFKLPSNFFYLRYDWPFDIRSTT